jgi:hypothetical protein
VATVTFADNAAAPAGAVATVAGSAGASNTVYVRRADQVWLPGAWTAAGSRTGDGAVALTLDPGVWWGWLQSGSSQPTVPQPFAVTDGLAKPPTRCRDAVAARVQLLDLPAVGSGDGRLDRPRGYYSQIVPDEANAQFPCLVFTCDGLSERKRPGTNWADEVGYPTRVLVADTNGRVQHAKLPAYEHWRYLLDRAFDNQVLPGVPESIGCTVEPQVVIDQRLPMYQHLISGLVVWSWCRVPRGLGV